jgi:hypothetical protein
MSVEHVPDGPTWWECEPKRLDRDRREIGERFPALEWIAEGSGGWRGTLPRWPFERSEPAEFEHSHR